MKPFSFSAIAAICLLFLCTAGLPPTHQLYTFNYENVLGTSLEIKMIASSEAIATSAEVVALKEIDRLNGILSTYDPSSEMSRWQKTLNTDINVSSELFEVLTLFDKWKQKTGGALSASAGIASALWKKASVDQQVPDQKELTLAVAAMKQSHWSLNKKNHTAKHLTTAPLAFNSFVKSYIIHKVSEKVTSLPGVVGSVVNIGGDLVVAGNQHERIRIADPKADAENDNPLTTLSINNKAIATSGNYRRGFQIDEQWFSHILDVRTAIPATEVISATVVAESASDAGALATAFNILTPEESAMLAKQIPGVEYQIITKTGEHFISEGWRTLEVTPSKNSTAQTIHINTDDKYELMIELELARFEGRFRRPFVAVWIENKKKESVRNLAVWYNKPRWLPDLKRWYSKNQSATQDPAIMESISSATRSAGKYTLTWDGLDNEGKPVSSGKYTIYIEAAREHGTYQLIKQEVEWNKKPKHLDLPGGVEITSAALDYHQVVNN